MKIATHTLGCKLNFAETSHMVKKFVLEGYNVVEFHDFANIYLINTCTVTSVAEKKCRNAIRQAVAQNPNAIVAVVGCFAQNAADEIAKIPGVDIILGNDQKSMLYDRVVEFQNSRAHSPASLPEQPQSFQLAYSSGDRTRTFFKIQDGCDYFCSYCAIPFARGRARNASIAETVAMAREIAATGAKEVVLTGVNTGTFGTTRVSDPAHSEAEAIVMSAPEGEQPFLQLLRQLDQIEGIERYRISSIEPNLLTDEIILFVKNSQRFAHHFHIPLQAGSDKVLRLMHRRYDTAFYAAKLQRIKDLMPEACIAADLMVGFYGEGESEFDEACRFVDGLPLSYLHVFPYSERPNTAALKLDGRVPVSERRRRSEVMHQISERKKNHFYDENRGRFERVLWESSRKSLCVGGVTEDYMSGFTGNYLRVQKKYEPQWVNQMETICLFDHADDVFSIC